VFLRPTPLTAPSPAIEALAAGVDADASGPERLQVLCARVNEAIAHRPGATHVGTAAAAALHGGEGVCQDRAHVFIAAARALGFPARYVSGYLLAEPEGFDALASHAWAEAWHPDLGWTGFDPSHGISPDERFIRVAVAPDYAGAAPIRGVHRGGSGEQLEIAVHVQQVAEQ
jgi:transglutaminase-like putative cysteine protease